MKIVILGSGNVATHLGKALQRIEANIVQVYSRSLQHAQVLADAVGSNAIDDLQQVDQDADLYIISVKDDVIAEIAAGLKNVIGIVVHTSGATDLSILTSLVKRAGVFYPLQTFSKTRAISFDQIPVCIEANNDADLQVLQTLASKLSRQVYTVDGEKRRILHLAAAFASNFPNHLYALANQILQQNDLDFQMIRPLIAETAEKVMDNLPGEVQTGPAIRGDEQTLNKHSDMLVNMPELQNIYHTLSDSIKLMRR